jgi:VanZ family protein
VPEQRWSNSRPVTHSPEMPPPLASSPIPAWLRAWWPALLWAGVIFVMSTDRFSAEHTGSFLEPIFRWLFPSLTADQFDLIHFCIRKSAHFTEYFVFCVLLYRAVRGSHEGWRWSWGLTALAIAAVYSALDEIHQAFVASRHASPYDSLLDSTGAFVATAALWLWFRGRKPAMPLAPSAHELQ